ncbi:expressed unknown protein [Seminavis robusta]|uniref:CS domain-containing protein n=1 Tax=Seminavis robusta TaxID=568900 RepID=A0A9N8DA89_9STRA|nr:expressed unknown protein [Seminavis robusta]|eukprot:Sro13_g010110.1 n/a (138) ;mRNA; r:122000-122413
MSNENCQFHQHGNFIHVLVKGRNVKEDDLDVQIQRRRLTVVIRGETMVEGLLHASVDVGNSRVKVHPDCVEIKLRKGVADEVWPELMLGVPDMMTSLQQAQAATRVSPEPSPSRPKPIADLHSSFNMSISNMFQNVA